MFWFVFSLFIFFFFKQKTAYEMRISDWSSDVCSSDLLGLGADAEQMTDRIGELGAVQRIEVEIADAAGIELAAKLGRDRGGDELARGGKRVQALEQPVHPRRDGRPAQRCARTGVLTVAIGQDAGEDAKDVV